MKTIQETLLQKEQELQRLESELKRLESEIDILRAAQSILEQTEPAKAAKASFEPGLATASSAPRKDWIVSSIPTPAANPYLASEQKSEGTAAERPHKAFP